MSQSTDKDDSHKEEFSSKENQEARAFLRERFLRVINTVAGKQCKIHTVDKNVTLSGEFQGCDIEVDKYLIKDLKTPMFQYTSSLIRATDVQSVSFPNTMKLLKPDKSD